MAVARGNEKGRVERAIRYVRENFFAARTWKNLEDLNTQAMGWCEHQASHRPCPEDKTLSVQEAFLQEQPKLIALPDNPYPTFEREEVSVGKTPYVRFDGNDYSVPHTHVRRLLTVIATQDTVSILDSTHTIAEHPRSYDKSQQIEQAAHLEALVEDKRQARHHRGQDRLTHAAPLGGSFLKEAAVRGYSLKSITKQLLQLLEDYGATELEAALLEALSRDVPHPNAVRLSLERRREEREQPPLIPLRLPDDKRVRELFIKPHALTDYDPLQSTTSQTSEEIKEDEGHDNR